MIQHHPDPDMLAEYAAGRLGGGAMLVVACHLEGCALCRRENSLWECAGGALLEEIEPAGMQAGALTRMLERLDESAKSGPALPGFLTRFDIPKALAAQKIGRRRFATPSIWFAPVAGTQGSARTYLVHAKADTVLAEHSHRGREFTHVIAGAFCDTTGTYAEGDFALTDDALTHSPAATSGSECLCLVSAEAPMRLTGFSARLLQALNGGHY